MAVHPAAIPIDQLLRECETTRTRRSGPGGQHRNKVETAIVLVHTPTGTRAEANERRSQEQNRHVAIFRLRVNLALAIRIPLADDASPSALWQRRRAGTRIQVNAAHDDFPALLAEALDVLASYNNDVTEAASHLQITTSQLIKFLKLDDRALQLINANRAANDDHPLR